MKQPPFSPVLFALDNCQLQTAANTATPNTERCFNANLWVLIITSHFTGNMSAFHDSGPFEMCTRKAHSRRFRILIKMFQVNCRQMVDASKGIKRVPFAQTHIWLKLTNMRCQETVTFTTFLLSITLRVFEVLHVCVRVGCALGLRPIYTVGNGYETQSKIA